ncbi:hypothetical protein TRICI_004612 [Trichomonascus ciferrii]|uniref:PH-response regulator protein palI/RIM9 n=1 Tax=Trichomonascus ciferrii TaxID=44093 RepID=A0A642V0H5_9ASCO|nr:hypothetical protein TRICI_004612 [Trichomonascus ciferrii]
MAMRIRVASTLSVLVLIAFALELIAVLSVPVTQTITLCEYGDYKFGVFGYCNTKTGHCSDVGVGYDVSNIDNKFSLPSNARNSLANLLIVHVVAAGLTLILLIFSLLAHVHGPANSSRFILFVLVFSIPSFLLTLLAFLVDILLFVSHLSWGGWIMLAATVLLLAALIVLCIMRRTLSSQKAMRKRLNVTSELHDMNDFGSQQPHGTDPFTGAASSRSNKEPDFTELKYETNTSDEVPLNNYDNGNNSQFGPNRHQSFILHDEPSDYQQPTSFTDHYQHATHNAYRGVANTATPSEFAATATTSLPTTGEQPQVPQIPAGMNIGDEDEANVNSGGDHNYGPNVVPIPMLKDEAAARRAHQRKPSGPRAYRPHHQAQYQHPPQPQYPQHHSAQYEQPQRATTYYEHEQQQQQPYEAEGQQEYEADPDYDDSQRQQQSYEPESSEPAAAAAYVPPRQQWQQQQPQYSSSSRRAPGGGYEYYDAESYPSTSSPPPPAHSPSAYSDGSYYQPPPPPSTQQHYYQPPRQPNRSDMVLESNPDFQIPPPSRANRQRRQKPPAASNADQPASSQGSSSQPSRPPPGRRKHPNMPAAFATSDSPYGISRAAGGGSIPPSI